MPIINFKNISKHELPEQSPGFLLWQVSTAWRSAIESKLKTFDLTHPQFVVLAALGWLTRHREQVNQAAIGKLAVLDPNTVSQVLKGLEKKQLIVRESSPDGRSKCPALTKKGAEVLKMALPAVEKTDKIYFQSLSRGELDSFLKLFVKLAAK